jgi:hypothetical protein
VAFSFEVIDCASLNMPVEATPTFGNGIFLPLIIPTWWSFDLLRLENHKCYLKTLLLRSGFSGVCLLCVHLLVW